MTNARVTFTVPKSELATLMPEGCTLLAVAEESETENVLFICIDDRPDAKPWRPGQQPWRVPVRLGLAETEKT